MSNRQHWLRTSCLVALWTVLGIGLIPHRAIAQRPHQSATSHAAVPVITLVPAGGPLRTQLKTQADSAALHGQVVLVDVGAPWCGPCKAFELSLREAGMVTALHEARLVHLDYDTWVNSLVSGGYIGAHDLPMFFLVTADGGPGTPFEKSKWDVYANSIHASVSEKNSDFWHAKVLGPPLQAFLAAARAKPTEDQ